MRRWSKISLCFAIAILAAGCPKGKEDYSAAKKALDVQNYDAAVDYYLKASKADPHNANYRIGLNRARFEAGQQHIHQGVKLREKGDLQAALADFQRAAILDPSSVIADQEVRKTLELIGERTTSAESNSAPLVESGQPVMSSLPPEIKPLSRAPINLKMSNDAKVVFDTIGKLAGLTVIYDPDMQARRVSTELTNVTLEQALDIVCLESKSFWKPVTENIIMVVPDQAQKRRDYEEQIVRTFYLSNVAIAQDLTEITTGLRQLLDLKRIQQVNAQNAIIIRDTPDKLALAGKIIGDIDKAKPEVIVQVEVLEARVDRMRDLGILPGQTASVTFNPNNSSTTSGGTPSTTGNTLNQLTHARQKDLVITVPNATANFLLTDTSTRIIQNPEIRAIDGQPAKLKIGDRVPIATGSFQAGVGVGSTGGSGFVNPLVNTQFQYIDVGVNIDVTPHVHANRDVSLKVEIEVSAVTGQQPIGGITQPIISQRKVTQEIRLKEGEVSILGGLIQQTDTKALNGWPGLAKIPVMRYLFSDDKVDRQEDEVLIVLTPRIVRFPEWTRANLRSISSGTETYPGAKRELDVKAPASNPSVQPQSAPPVQTAPVAPAAAPVNPPATGPVTQSPLTSPPSAAAPSQPQTESTGPRMRFEPANLSLSVGQTATLGVVVENVTDLYSVPMLLQFNPAIVSVEEVRHGGFLSGGTQEIAIVQRVDKEHGQAIISATRQPNTPGVNGTGTLLGVVVKGLAPGTSNISIVQINAKDSQQKPIPLITSEATVKVQ